MSSPRSCSLHRREAGQAHGREGPARSVRGCGPGGLAGDSWVRTGASPSHWASIFWSAAWAGAPASRGFSVFRPGSGCPVSRTYGDHTPSLHPLANAGDSRRPAPDLQPRELSAHPRHPQRLQRGCAGQGAELTCGRLPHPVVGSEWRGTQLVTQLRARGQGNHHSLHTPTLFRC